MASTITQEEENGVRLRLLLEEGSNVLLQKLFDEIGVTPSTFDVFLQSKKAKLSKLQSSSKSPYNHEQHDILFPPSGAAVDVNNIDITLTYVLFRSITTLKGPWGPSSPRNSLQRKIECLRGHRNNILHGNLRLTSSEFANQWNDLKSAISDLGGDAAKMDTLKTLPIDNSLVNKLNISENLMAKFQDGLRNTFHDVPKVIPNFVGRDCEIEEIRRLIEEENKEIIVLSGEGGVGKTETALKYIEIHRSSVHGNNVVWINAESQATLGASFTGFATKQELTDGSEPLQDIIHKSYSFYSSNAKKVLFVLDNADDLIFNQNIMKSYFPTMSTPYVKILVTSRLKQWKEWGYELLDIVTFPKETAQALIKNELYQEQQSIDIGQISLLVEKLSCLPLALQQCTSYIKLHHISIQKYLQLFDHHIDTVFSKGYGKYGKTVVQCCKVTLGALEEKALQILYTVSILDSTRVTEALLSHLPNSTEIDISEVIAGISARSLIKHDGTFFTMHSLTRTVIRNIIEQKGLMEHFIQISINLVCTAIARNKIPEQHYNYGDIWLNHVSTIVKECNIEHGTLLLSLIDCLGKIISAFENTENFVDAEVFLLALRTKIGRTHILKEQGCIDIYIYFILLKQRKYSEARDHFRMCNELTNAEDIPLDLDGLDSNYICETADKERSRYMLITFHLYADKHRDSVINSSRMFLDWYKRMYISNNIRESNLMIQMEFGIRRYFCDYGKAYDKFNPLTKDFLLVFGGGHEMTLLLYAWIGTCKFMQSKYEDADEAFKTLFEQCTNFLGPNHGLSYYAKWRQIQCLREQHMLVQARTECKDLLHQQQKSVGLQHRYTLHTQYELKRCLRKIVQQEAEQCKSEPITHTYNIYVDNDDILHSDDNLMHENSSAAEELQHLYITQHKTLGAFHRETLLTRFQICISLHDLKQYEEAGKEFKMLYDLQNIHLGEGHEDTLKSLYWYCHCLHDLKQYEEAKIEFKSNYDLRVANLGEGHEDSLKSLYWYCMCLYTLKQYEEAKIEFKKHYDLRVANLGEGHKDTLTFLFCYCACLHELKQYEEEKIEFKSNYDLQVANLGEGHEDTLKSLYRYCYCLHDLKQYEEAGKEFKMLYDLQNIHLGEGHEDTLKSLYWYCHCLHDLKQYEEAKIEFKSNYDLRVANLGEGHRDTLSSLHWYCRCLYDLKQYEEAKIEFKNNYDLRVANLGEDHQETILSWYWSVVCNYKFHHYEECKEQFTMIYDKEVVILSENHQSSLSTRFWYAKCLYSLHEYETAMDEFQTVYKQRVQVIGATAEYTTSTLYWHAICLHQLQQYQHSKEEFEQVYEQRSKDLGVDHDKTISTLFWIARCNYSLGHYIPSKEAFQNVHKQRVDLLGDSHKRTIDAQCWLAKCLYHFGEYEESQDIFEKVKNAQHAILDGEDPEFVNILLWIGKCIEKRYPDMDII